MAEKEIKKFDLNIEKILEDWEVYHGLREVIANALDEQALSHTKDISISKDSKGMWHIRDYGRGLKYNHLTQKENKEKLENPNMIGKFGIGLKDALATFDRKGIKVLIKSKYGDITLDRSEKQDFKDIITLHACISAPTDQKFIGTEFVFSNIKNADIARAKELFLKFSGDKEIDKTRYGEILEKQRPPAKIYINGVKVAEEENFLFSYNITSLDKAIKKALNRERTNVGRTAYVGRVKALLLECKNKKIAKMLVEDLKHFEDGKLHDELQWVDISVHACKLLNASGDVIFLTPAELISAKDMVERAEADGLEIITIPESVKTKIEGLKDFEGNPIRDLGAYKFEWNKSFEFKFVSEKNLTKQEREIFHKTTEILNLMGGKPKNVKQILISETMRLDSVGYGEAVGIYEAETERIIIKRDQLRKLQTYAGTLLHETAHATSGASDTSVEFELELSRLLGIVAAKRL